MFSFNIHFLYNFFYLERYMDIILIILYLSILYMDASYKIGRESREYIHITFSTNLLYDDENHRCLCYVEC